MPDRFEIFLNENTADLQVFRITLAALLLRLVGPDPPTAKAKMQDLKNSVIGAIGRIETDPKIPGSERIKQMTAMRAEKFFLELEEVVSENLKRWDCRAIIEHCSLAKPRRQREPQRCSSFTAAGLPARRAGALPTAMTKRRFPPPWSAELTPNCFIVRDANGQALELRLYENEPGRRSAGHARG